MLNGEPVDADEWNRRLRVNIETAVCSVTLALSGSVQDVAGCSVTFVTEAANAAFIAYGVFDMSMGATSNSTGVGILDVDGTDESRQAIFNGQTSGVRASVMQVWNGVLAAAGSHTFKLQAQRAVGAGAINVNTTHTTITVHVMEVA